MEIESGRINYRRATARDLETLVEYRVRFLNEVYNHSEDEETMTLRRSLRQYFTEAIPFNHFIAWVAECDGKVIGTGGMVVWQMPGRYRGLESGRLGYILNMYTIPEARRKGVCTRLLQELIGEAKSMRLKYLHLHSSRDGIGVYRKAGFTEPFQPELVLRL